jgi:hypothetical protein
VLIIFGLRVFYRTTGQGTFFCRRCGGDRRYRLRAGRRFLTLFFLPVIPLTRAGQHVQCLTCRTRYLPDVLALPTSAQLQAALPAAMRAAAAAMLHAEDPERPAARQAAAAAISATGGPAGEDALPSTPLSAEATRHALGQVARQLSPDARELFLARVVRIGTADGTLTERERQAAYAIAAALGMTQAQAVGVITLAERAARD